MCHLLLAKFTEKAKGTCFSSVCSNSRSIQDGKTARLTLISDIAKGR